MPKITLNTPKPKPINLGQNQQGFVALFVVVIISATALLLSYNASFLSLGELDLGFTNQKGAEALAISDLRPSGFVTIGNSWTEI